MSLTKQQVETLLKPIHPSRVLRDNKGMAHVSQQDIRAHLTRVFGFGGWSSEVVSLDLVREAPGVKDGKEKGWAVTYRCVVRLTIRDPHGQQVAIFEDAGTGTSPNLPTLGDAHDFACKVAVSMALKRAATNLGDGFGLSLYNKGQMAPLVIGTLVVPDGEGTDASDAVPEQSSMGHDDAGSQDITDGSAPAASAPPLDSLAPGEPVLPGPDDGLPSPEATVGEFRARVIDLMGKPRKDALIGFARLKAEIAKAGLAGAATTTPMGRDITLGGLCDEALDFVSKKEQGNAHADVAAGEQIEVPA